MYTIEFLSIYLSYDRRFFSTYLLKQGLTYNDKQQPRTILNNQQRGIRKYLQRSNKHQQQPTLTQNNPQPNK